MPWIILHLWGFWCVRDATCRGNKITARVFFLPNQCCQGASTCSFKWFTGMTLSTVYLLCCKYTTRSRSSKLDSRCEQIKFQDAWSTFKSGVLRNKHFLIFITQKNFEKNNNHSHIQFVPTDRAYDMNNLSEVKLNLLGDKKGQTKSFSFWILGNWLCIFVLRLSFEQ